MIIIKDNVNLEFCSWDQVVSEIKIRKVKNPEISTNELLLDIEILKNVAQKSFFSKPQLHYISSLINQIKFYDSSKRYSFIEDLHKIGRLTSSLKKHPRSKNLFDKGIFTNFGFFSQFLISAWLNKYVNVVDFELRNKPLNTDVLVNELKIDIHFHIKDIREEETKERYSDMCMYIDSFFTEKARERRDNKHIAVIRVRGFLPKRLPKNYWQGFVLKLEEKKQKIKVSFPPRLGYGNSEEIAIEIQLDWRPFSGIFISPLGFFNNSFRLSTEYEKINKLVAEHGVNQIHILVFVTEDRYSTKALRKFIEHQKVGIMTLEIVDFEFDRSTLVLPENKELETYLNKKILRYVEVVV